MTFDIVIEGFQIRRIPNDDTKYSQTYQNNVAIHEIFQALNLIALINALYDN